MAQWFAIKADHEDALLFFRMGDFYELFFADAQAASAALDIALTARGQHQGRPIPMCGVPVSQAELYLARLIRRGFRVAIVEQMEDPAAAKARGAKGPLARAVVRLVTPGTLTEDALLESGRANFCIAIMPTGEDIGLAWADISTGLFATQITNLGGLTSLLGQIDPAEIIGGDSLDLGPHTPRRVDISRLAVNIPRNIQAARHELAAHFNAASLDAFGVFSDVEVQAATTLIAYFRATQMGNMPRLSRPEPAGANGQLLMDAATRASLEITANRAGEESGSLLSCVKRTVSAPGARLLAAWLSAPLNDLGVLHARQTAWRALQESGQAEAIKSILRGAPDMARSLSRIALCRASPRDLAAIANGLALAAELAPLLPSGIALLDAELLIPAPELATTLKKALSEPAPLRLDDGGVIAPAFDGELDAQRALRDDTRQIIAAFQTELASRSGIASLKIRHHAQMGYVAEVPASAAQNLREHPEFLLRQGMANGARFTHPELSALDQRIAEAASAVARREAIIFNSLIKQINTSFEAISACGQALALLDVLQSAASLAATGRWQAPTLTDDEAFAIDAARHPVVEAALPPGNGFIANDCTLEDAQRIMLLTGPNMAGKSTYLRQNALLVILAQAGLPVPAAAMRLGLVDRLFSRVGAADDLASGRSTFMVEMTETAAILHQAGPKSFVIVDEIGRGTGTRDGLAIAQAVLEALHNSNRCRAIFATHFHELIGLAELLPRLVPYTVRVKEYRGEVVFMHEVIRGAASRSWGVHVARLAGVPDAVSRRADALLKSAERNSPANALPLFAATVEPVTADPILDDLAALQPDKMSPRDALDAIYSLQNRLRAKPE